MKKIPVITYMLLLFLFTAGCARVDVQSDYARNTDFTKYKTYAWMPTADSAMTTEKYNATALQASFMKEINEEMQARGYELDPDNPDVVLHMQMMFETKTDVIRRPVYAAYNYYTPGFYTGPFYHYYWPGYTTLYEVVGYNIETIRYKEGNIIVDMIDPKTKHIVWRGWTEDALQSHIEDEVDDIASDMFDKNFPVKEKVKSESL